MPSLHYRLIALVSIVVIVCDQIVKWRMVAWLGPLAAEHRWELMGSFLAFEYVENTGAAFGILAGRVWLVSILALVVAALFMVLVVFGLEATPLNHVASGMIIGGAAGNMIDRLRLGYVIDYIAVGDWPRFNLADSAVTVGIALVIMKLVRDGDHDAESDGTTVESSGAPRSIPYKDQHERNDSVR